MVTYGPALGASVVVPTNRKKIILHVTMSLEMGLTKELSLFLKLFGA